MLDKWCRKEDGLATRPGKRKITGLRCTKYTTEVLQIRVHNVMRDDMVWNVELVKACSTYQICLCDNVSVDT